MVQDLVHKLVRAVLFDFDAEVAHHAVITGRGLMHEADVVQLLDVGHVEDREAPLEFLGQLLYVLFVAQRQQNTVDAMVLASSQLFANATDADDFAESGDFTGHGQVAHDGALCGNRHQGREE